MRQRRFLWQSLFLALFFLVSVPPARAHVPLLEVAAGKPQSLKQLDFAAAETISDPTFQSLALYGRLVRPSEADLYRFTASTSELLRLELLVPAWPGADRFYPELLIIGPGVGSRLGRDLPADLVLPSGLSGFSANNQLLGRRALFFEPYSLERLYRGEEIEVQVESGQTYYLAVYQPDGLTGAYSLSLGSKENFDNQSLPRVIWSVLLMKTGLFEAKNLPWLGLAVWFFVFSGLVWLFFAGRHLYLVGRLSADPAGLESLFRQGRQSALRSFGVGLFLWLFGQLWLNQISWLSGTAFFEALAAVFLALSFAGLSSGFRADWWLVKRPGSGQSQVRRPRRFRFVYRLYQFFWLVLFFGALWRLIAL